jgi:RNA polymerase sigma-70 factor (ECF subfamily)
MISKNDPDYRLIVKAKAGNSLAFGKLVEKYRDQILNLAYDFSGDYNQAKDIAQEVFLKVFVSISSFEGKSKFSTWLYRVAVNTSLDEIKKSKKKSFRLFSDTSVKDKIENKAVPDETQKTEIDLKTAKLSAQQTTAVILRFYNDLKIDEIAHIMECSENTARTHIFRAIEKLKKTLVVK